jgi:hypothetical protein
MKLAHSFIRQRRLLRPELPDGDLIGLPAAPSIGAPTSLAIDIECNPDMGGYGLWPL